MFAGIEKYTTFATANTGIAQLVEHRSPKPSVGSSSLSSRAAQEAVTDRLRLLCVYGVGKSCRFRFQSFFRE